MFRCFVVASPQSLFFLNLKAALFCRPTSKSVCRQMITFSSLMDKGHSPIVNNCPLFIVLQTALLFLLVWAPPVVGNSSTWDTQRPLDRTATLCDRELVFVTVCASTGGHQRQYGRKFGDRSRRSILVSTSIKHVIGRCAVALTNCCLFVI